MMCLLTRCSAEDCLTYEDNKTKRSTLRDMGGVCALASDLCFLDDIQLRTLVFVDRKKVLWLYR